MSIPQKSLFSLLSWCQKFYNPSKFGKVVTKNKFAVFFWDTVYSLTDRDRSPRASVTSRINIQQSVVNSVLSSQQLRLDSRQKSKDPYVAGCWVSEAGGIFVRGVFSLGGLFPRGSFARGHFWPGGIFVRGCFCPGGLCPFSPSSMRIRTAPHALRY